MTLFLDIKENSLFLAKWVYNLVPRSARAVCELRVGPSELQTRSCHLYPTMSAMTSYSSWRHGAFLFLGNIRLKAINDQSTHEELSFHRLQNNVYYRWISSHFSCKQNRKHKNAELSILAGEDLTPKNPLERRTPTWNSTAQATKMDGDGSNKKRSRENITQWISNDKVL